MNLSRSVVTELKNLVRQSSHYLLGLLGGLAFGFVSFPIFTRMFTVVDYGQIDLAQKIFLLATAFGKAGLQNSALRLYNRERFSAEPDAAKRYYSTLLFGVAGVALSLTVLFILTLQLLPKNSFIDGPLSAILKFGSILILLRAVQSLLWSFLRIQEKTKTYNIAGLVIRAASVGIICLLVPFLGPSVKTYYSGTILVELGVVVFLCWPLLRGGLISPASFSMEQFRVGFAFGAPLIVQELAGLILDSGDRALVRVYLGGESLGLYSVAYGLASYVNTLLYTPLGLAILPIYMRIWNAEGRQKTIEFVSFSFDVFLGAAGFLFAVVMVVSRDTVTLLASSKYRGADTMIPTLVAGLLIYTMQIFLNAGLLIQKRTGIMAMVLCASAVLNVVLNIVLLPKMGMQGAAVATLLSYLLCTILLSIPSFRVLPLNVSAGSVMRYVAATVAAIGLAAQIHLPVPLWNLILRSGVVSLVYGATLYACDSRVRSIAAQVFLKLRYRKLEMNGLYVR